jgi:hypothetical protein
MRAFYSRLFFLDINGARWTSWIMSVGIDSLEPMFCHVFLYCEHDNRVDVAKYLREKKAIFHGIVIGYYSVQSQCLH